MRIIIGGVSAVPTFSVQEECYSVRNTAPALNIRPSNALPSRPLAPNFLATTGMSSLSFLDYCNCFAIHSS